MVHLEQILDNLSTIFLRVNLDLLTSNILETLESYDIVVLIKIETKKISIIKLSQLETILNYALQFRLKTKSNKFCRKWRHDIVSHYYFK